ncbi:DUF5400 domain-containing protein [Methanogenium organophilum]|uniref:DUF5400 domain-containing protein n=1 Tax=Methanogenium organophilum TaxID=2199 RepID=A0A9X9T7T1_METOG|nr:DUF5400 domain-containing protein [Methanogenium organophilum]WAI01718.1 DUF5400 domain-containing protein [Methanogenium organophilum]
MEITYQVIALAVLFSGIASGFITFRMLGMKLAPHFGALILALLVTFGAILTGNILVAYTAALLQIVATVTAYTQMWATLKYSFQTSPGYGPHLALVTLLPVLAVAGILL